MSKKVKVALIGLIGIIATVILTGVFAIYKSSDRIVERLPKRDNSPVITKEETEYLMPALPLVSAPSVENYPLDTKVKKVKGSYKVLSISPSKSFSEYESGEDAYAYIEALPPSSYGSPTESYPQYTEVKHSNNPDTVKSNKFDEYTVTLGVDENMTLNGLAGELRVTIGPQDLNITFPTAMVQDKTNIPSGGESAKVEPFALAFKIQPKVSQCIRIHPSGSEVRFKLIPQKEGIFEVGANVFLFDSLDCSGSPIPKTTATLKVLVKVDIKEIFHEKSNELGNILWAGFLDFWAVLIALFFGLVLFLIRGKLKRWFGYE